MYNYEKKSFILFFFILFISKVCMLALETNEYGLTFFSFLFLIELIRGTQCGVNHQRQPSIGQKNNRQPSTVKNAMFLPSTVK